MKLPKILHLLAAFTLIGLTGFGPDAARADAPQDTVKQLLGSIQQMHHKKPLTAEQKQSNETISQQALGHLDVPLVSQKTLGSHWKQRSSEEQAGFVELLGDLFRYVAFPNSSKFFGEMKLTYAETRTEGGTATVPITVMHPEEGAVRIDFVLEQNSKRWRVVDVILDGVSMRNNLRTQFSKVLKKHDYPELTRRMQKKLDSAK
ncbi:MAG: ABC transporter substrate-binding protein [Nitrospinota bacterium]|nr:ABC transporter substrate-binding protein [Nitrospinota bacterium]